MAPGPIDFHHHARPAAFFDALAATGRNTMGGRPFPPAWTADAALSMMDRMGIAAAVVSAPDADVLYRDRPTALRLSRLLNDLYAELIAKRPSRFGAFASLPMPHLDDAVRELAYAMDELRLDGAMLSTSYDGRFLGDPCFDALLAELDRRACPVFVHPVTPMGIAQLSLDFPASLLEYAFDTTRCIMNMIRRDVPTRFPRIKFIMSHAGGAAPFLLPRATLMGVFTNPKHEFRAEADRARIEQGLRAMTYDIAMASSGAVLRLLEETVGIERIVFGTDYPLVPDGYIEETKAGVEGARSLDAAQRQRIARGNGLALIPRLATP